MTVDQDQAITDYAASIFLRYFRAGTVAGARTPRIERSRDLHVLRTHWAISESVRRFLTYLLSHRHEVQGLLQYNRRTDDSIARGRIDARATSLAQAMSGHPSLVVYEEPIRSFNTGPNHVVAWVIQNADVQVTRLHSWQVASSAYRPVVDAVMTDLTAVKRLEYLREALRLTIGTRRPSLEVLRSATRSRRMIYRYAVVAYNMLRDMEVGDPVAIASVLRSTLMAPLEDWRRFELAVALGIGQAMEEETGDDLALEIVGGSSGMPIVRCGHLSIHWQGRPLFTPPQNLEPSELRLQTALSAYDMSPGDDRPDLVVVDERRKSVLAIVEVKYVAGDNAVSRFREALGQVVRYVRGYAEDDGIPSLIRRSLIITSEGARQITDSRKPAPGWTDFPNILNGSLNAWVRERLLTSL